MNFIYPHTFARNKLTSACTYGCPFDSVFTIALSLRTMLMKWALELQPRSAAAMSKWPLEFRSESSRLIALSVQVWFNNILFYTLSVSYSSFVSLFYKRSEESKIKIKERKWNWSLLQFFLKAGYKFLLEMRGFKRLCRYYRGKKTGSTRYVFHVGTQYLQKFIRGSSALISVVVIIGIYDMLFQPLSFS